MRKKQSWVGKIGEEPYTQHHFDAAVKAAKALPMTRFKVLPHVQGEHLNALEADYELLHGGTLSSGGKFAMLDSITPASTGDMEAQWFRDIARHYQKLFNSMMGRKLDDNSTFPYEKIDKLSEDNRSLVMHIIQNISAINNVFPLKQEAHR